MRERGKGRETGDPVGEVVPSPIPAAGLVPLFWDSQLGCYGIAVI